LFTLCSGFLPRVSSAKCGNKCLRVSQSITFWKVKTYTFVVAAAIQQQTMISAMTSSHTAAVQSAHANYKPSYDSACYYAVQITASQFLGITHDGSESILVIANL